MRASSITTEGRAPISTRQPVAPRIDSPLMAGVSRCLHGAALFCSRRSSSARRSKSAAVSAYSLAKKRLSAAAAHVWCLVFAMPSLSVFFAPKGYSTGFKNHVTA